MSEFKDIFNLVAEHIYRMGYNQARESDLYTDVIYDTIPEAQEALLIAFKEAIERAEPTEILPPELYLEVFRDNLLKEIGE